MGLLDDAIREHLELKRRRGADAGEVARLESEALGPVRRSAEGVPELADTFDPGEPAVAADEAVELPPADYDPSPVAPVPAREPEFYDPPPGPPPPSSEPASDVPPPDVAPRAREPVSYDPPPVAPPPAAPPRAREPEPWKPDPAPRYRDPEPAPEPEPEPAAGAGRDFAPEPPSLLSRLRPGRRHKRHPRREEPAAGHPEPDPYEPPAPPPVAYPAAPPPAADEPDIVPADDEPDGEDLLEETPDFLEETPEHERLWFEQRPPRDFKFDD